MVSYFESQWQMIAQDLKLAEANEYNQGRIPINKFFIDRRGAMTSSRIAK